MGAADILALLDKGRMREQAQAATIASLRSRLSLFAEHVCEGCGCAPYGGTHELALCNDCFTVDEGFDVPEYPYACISVGLRALCGRRILEGC